MHNPHSSFVHLVIRATVNSMASIVTSSGNNDCGFARMMIPCANRSGRAGTLLGTMIVSLANMLIHCLGSIIVAGINDDCLCQQGQSMDCPRNRADFLCQSQDACRLSVQVPKSMLILCASLRIHADYVCNF